MSLSDFFAHTMWSGWQQKQKESCESLTMTVRINDGIGKSILQSTKEQYRVMESLIDMATVK